MEGKIGGDPFPDDIQIKTVVLKKIQNSLQMILTPMEYRSLSFDMNRYEHEIVFRVRKEMFGERRQDTVNVKFTAQYPDGWWQAFKDEMFPKWLLRHYPVKMKVINETKEVTLDRTFWFPEIPVNDNSPVQKFVIYDRHQVNNL